MFFYFLILSVLNNKILKTKTQEDFINLPNLQLFITATDRTNVPFKMNLKRKKKHHSISD